MHMSMLLIFLGIMAKYYIRKFMPKAMLWDNSHNTELTRLELRLNECFNSPCA